MNRTPALRIRREQEIDLKSRMPDLSNGFTIEAWVRPAPMDQAARLYPQQGYDGLPIRLKAGLYKNIANDHLPQLGAVCLPENIEAVFFGEPNFQGAAFAVRHDLPLVPDAQQKIGSVVVLDRSHRRQNHVVLFEQAGYQGLAEVLILPDFWQPANATAGGKTKPGLQQVGSAWVPAGVALEVESAGGQSTLRGDLSQLPGGATRIATRRDAPLMGNELIFTTVDDPATEQRWPLPTKHDDYSHAFRTVRVPAGAALFLFEQSSYGGHREIVVGDRDDLTDLPWTPKSAVFAATPDGLNGILCLQPDIGVLAQGSNTLPPNVQIWYPDGYRLSAILDGLGEYLYFLGVRGVFSAQGDSKGGSVEQEQYVGILSTDNGYGLTIERLRGNVRGAHDELRFGGELLRPDRWYHLAQSWDGQTECLCWYLNGRQVKQAKLKKDMVVRFAPWALGRCFRGTLAQVRVWNSARTPEQIRDDRYPSASPAAPPTLDLFAGGFDRFKLSDAAAVVWADLPQTPAETVFVKRMQQQVETEHAQAMQTAQQQATAQLALADKRAQRKTALAREQARRDVHWKGMKRFAFVRGDEVISSESKVELKDWSTLEDGVNDDIRALACDAAGNLYAGGQFSQAGGAAANHIAKWDGSRWSALGDGVNDGVNALAFDAAGNLYAGGNFYQAGGAAANRIAKWDGSRWSALGDGVNDGVNDAVLAVAFDAAGNLYAGGNFTQIGVPNYAVPAVEVGKEAMAISVPHIDWATANHTAKWDGSRWSALGDGVNGAVYALACDTAGNLYAGGTFTQAGGAAANYIAKWDGRGWSAVGGGLGGPVNALAFDAGNLYAGVDCILDKDDLKIQVNYVAKWDGSCWSILGDLSNSSDFTLISLARWDGSRWSILGDVLNGTVRTLVFGAAGNLYAGGKFTFTQANSVVAHYIAKWDGSRWSILGDVLNGPVSTLACDAAGNLYAGGEFTQAGGAAANHIAKWVNTPQPHDLGNLRITDLAMDAEGSRYVSLDGGSRHIRNLETNQAVSADLPNPPQALTGDFSGNHFKAKAEGTVLTGFYWIEADGAVCRTWIRPEEAKPTAREPLFGSLTPLGRPGYWDMTLDAERQRLYWTNGWELYWSRVEENDPHKFQILLPHVASPFPIAVAVAPDGSLLWLDAEDEVVRVLPFDQKTSTFGAAKELYPAPKPTRSLAVCSLADAQQSGNEAAFVYWVAAERRTLEAPVLDAPGRYIDLYWDADRPRTYGQHVTIVAVDQVSGAQWEEQKQDSNLDSNLNFSSGEDDITFEPVRLDLHQGWTVSADLIWEQVASDPNTSVCLYELATFEDEERIVCAIEADVTDSQRGLPTLHVRWNGQVLTGERNIVSGSRLKIGQRQRVTWMLDSRGCVTTFIDGENVLEEQLAWSGGVRVFEGHSLGAPNTAQTHPEVKGALYGNDDDTKRIFTGFQGRIVRFAAWNSYIPQAAAGWEDTPDPDPTWARSLVTVESKRRYLHAGRLDGKEPPVTLFPIDMDGGLNIESVLDQAHAELTHAHSQMAAATAYATQLKELARQQAQAQVDAATQKLADTQAKAAADVAAAQERADSDKAAARARMVAADVAADRGRSMAVSAGGIIKP